MELRLAKIYTFSLFRQSFSVRWFGNKEYDEEAFTLDLLEQNVAHGAVGNIEEFMSLLPFIGDYAEAETFLKEGRAYLDEVIKQFTGQQ